LTSDTWVVSIDDLRGSAAVEPLWRELQARADHSFFQSWGWIGAWLRTFPEHAGLLCLRVCFQGRVVGLSVLGRNEVATSRFFSSRALLVSEAGVPDHDSLTVEHSGMLMERGLEREILEHGFRHLYQIDWPWDELFVSGVEHQHAAIYVDAAKAAGLTPEVRAEHPYYFVDLNALRDAGGDYLATLSRNTRFQIKRAMRLYESHGALRVYKAQSLPEALAMFEKLKRVHQACWVARGEPGAFATERITEFHQQLISACFERGEVQLLEVYAGEHVLGYLYNFVMDGVVSNYQTAFLYEDDARLKPGLVSHALAVEQALSEDLSVYDFLMGDQRFKRSLAKSEGTMLWLVLSNDSIRSSFRARARRLRDWLKR
jgi:CelD/BcsL family acetyltransferase involved in cellulose biosynthesis